MENKVWAKISKFVKITPKQCVMRKFFMLLGASVFMMMSFVACAQKNADVELLPPSKERGDNLMVALQKRMSVREYSEKEISLQDLSDLLWAAKGINRPDAGKLTAPTARNQQEISLYLVTPKAVYLYDASSHILKFVKEGDFRKSVAGPQDFAALAPIQLVIVGDMSVFPAEKQWAMTDAGYVSQNIYLFCAANGMATVARGMMAHDEVAKALNLPSTHQPILNHPVGYMK